MQQTQQRLWQNMAHSEMNGVEVIQRLGRLRGSQRQPLDAGSVYQYAGDDAGRHDYRSGDEPSVRRTLLVYSRKRRRRSGWIIRSAESDGELMFSWYCMDNVLETWRCRGDVCTIAPSEAVIAAPEKPEDFLPAASRTSRRRWPLNAQADYDLRILSRRRSEYPGIRRQSGNNRTGRVDAGYRDADDPSPSAAMMPDEHELKLALP